MTSKQESKRIKKTRNFWFYSILLISVDLANNKKIYIYIYIYIEREREKFPGHSNSNK